MVDDKPAEKPEEEGLTFNEWAQKVLAEEEKEKHHGEILLNNVYTPYPPHLLPEEEGLTFNEWAQKVLAEEEKENIMVRFY